MGTGEESERRGRETVPDSKEREKRCILISRMITWFDAESELIPTDVNIIERALRDYSGTDIFAIWKDVREDFVAISSLPAKSEELTKFSRMLTRVRFGLFLGSVAAMVFTLVVSFKLIALPFDPSYIVFALFIILYGVFALNTFLNRSYNRKLAKLYSDHLEEFSSRRKKIRKATQKLIDKLNSDVRSFKLEPNKFSFDVVHSDYKNIIVTKKRGARLKATVSS